MRIRGRIRPSRPMSVIGLVTGIVFTGIGLFVVIPEAGPFGIIWTLLAVGATVYYGSNALSERGMAHAMMDFETGPPDASMGSRTEKKSVEGRLRELDSLRSEDLINQQEYDSQRQRILDEL